jgi:serine/threonine protein kinase
MARRGSSEERAVGGSSRTEFVGNDRFQVERKLGAGGMGLVFQAFDKERGERVALKTLRYIDPAALLSFKQEFRALADLDHPNLCSFFELLRHDDEWFFSMELVDGWTLLDYVRGAGGKAPPTDPGSGRTELASPASSPPSGGSERTTARFLTEPDSDRPTFGESGVLGFTVNESERPTLGPVGGGSFPAEVLLGSGSGADRVTPTHPRLVLGPPARAHGVAPEAVMFSSPIEPTLAAGGAAAERTPAPSLPEAMPTADPTRLRDCLRQLAMGLNALHAAGKLHRDVKPSNVMVTREGRVVVLDFGLALDLGGRRGKGGDGNPEIVGTVAYMSPEQAAGEQLTPASDWYSVGATVYEGLTGKLPFTGSLMETLLARQIRQPAPPDQLQPGLPPDLCALCMDLLQPRPENRPTGEQVLRRLTEPTATTRLRISSQPSLRPRDTSLVGRERHLAQLRHAFEEVKEGRAQTVLVHGRSGMGKSRLIQGFLDDINAADAATVFSGRCYERESVPFKALDSVVDSIVTHLGERPAAEQRALLDADVTALARLFPVLRRLQAVVALPPVEILDPQEVRRRAAGALRELLVRLTAARPAILHIDDIHWGDIDSAALLGELMRPPHPRLLFLCSYRTDEGKGSELVQSLLSRRGSADGAPAPQVVEVGPLEPAEAERLARALLSSGQPRGGLERLAARIAAESEGHPYFVQTLATEVDLLGCSDEPGGVAAATGEGWLASAEPGGAPRRLTLDEVLWSRVETLETGARQLLQVLAVAGSPLPQAVAHRAAALIPEGPADPASAQAVRTAMVALRAAQLIRTRGIRDSDVVEPYHDRIRETVLAHLQPAVVKDHHRHLAVTLEASGNADPEVLALHYHGAGDDARAGRLAEQAAARAATALAFEHAARLYRLALEYLAPGEAEASPLHGKLGDALANAGRGALAAEAYRRAIRGATSAESLEYQRRGAEQLLISGHIDEGVDMMAGVLSQVGFELAPTPARALASLLFRRAQIRLRGLGYSVRDQSQISTEELRRIDICWSVSLGLGMYDTVRGADFQMRHLLLSLKAGEPYRIARAMATEAGYVATAGGPGRDRARRLSADATRLAARIGHPHAVGIAQMCAGLVSYLTGEWPEALGKIDEAIQTLRSRCTGVHSELNSTELFRLGTLYYLGQMGELCTSHRRLLKESEDQGNLYVGTNLRTGIPGLPWLVSDQPDESARQLDQAMKQWSHRSFHLQHWYDLLGRGQIDLYQGTPDPSWDRVEKTWSALKRSLILQIQVVDVEAHQLRARIALARAAVDRGAGQASTRKSLLACARADARHIAGLDMPWTSPVADLLLAGAEAVEGQPQRAIQRLRSAATGFGTTGLRLFRAAAEWRLGQILGGDRGAELVDGARGFMAGVGVLRPERFCAVLAPGFAG